MCRYHTQLQVFQYFSYKYITACQLGKKEADFLVKSTNTGMVPTDQGCGCGCDKGTTKGRKLHGELRFVVVMLSTISLP